MSVNEEQTATDQVSNECRIHFPVVAIPEGRSAIDNIYEQALSGLSSRISGAGGTGVPKNMVRRLKAETDILHTCGFISYVLLAADAVKAVPQDGTQKGRQPAANRSAFAFGLGLSDTPPNRAKPNHELRDELLQKPGVIVLQLAYTQHGQDQLFKYLAGTYGKDNLCLFEGKRATRKQGDKGSLSVIRGFAVSDIPIREMILGKVRKFSGYSLVRASEAELLSKGLIPYRLSRVPRKSGKAMLCTATEDDIVKWIYALNDAADEDKHRKVISLKEKLLPALRSLHGPDDCRIPQVLARAGTALRAMRRLKEAEACFRDAVDTESQYGNDPCGASFRASLADLLVSQGRHSEALPLYVDVLDIYAQILAPESGKVISALLAVSTSALMDARCHVEMPGPETLIELTQRVCGERAQVLMVLDALVDRLHDGEHVETVYRLLQYRAEVTEALYGSRHIDLAIALHRFAEHAIGMDRYGEAEAALLREREIREHVHSLLGEESELYDCLALLQSVYLKSGRKEERMAVLDDLVDVMEDQSEPPYALMALALSEIGMYHRSVGEHENAEEAFEVALISLEDEDEWSEMAPGLYRQLAMTQRDLGKLKKARKSIEKCLDIVEEDYDELHRERFLGLRVAARLFAETGDVDRGNACWQKASEAVIKHEALVHDPEYDGWGSFCSN